MAGFHLHGWSSRMAGFLLVRADVRSDRQPAPVAAAAGDPVVLAVGVLDLVTRGVRVRPRADGIARTVAAVNDLRQRGPGPVRASQRVPGRRSRASGQRRRGGAYRRRGCSEISTVAGGGQVVRAGGVAAGDAAAWPRASRSTAAPGIAPARRCRPLGRPHVVWSEGAPGDRYQ